MIVYFDCDLQVFKRYINTDLDLMKLSFRVVFHLLRRENPQGTAIFFHCDTHIF